jgi:hypothetical protein
MGRIYDYKAKYSHYLELRKDRRVHQQKHMMNNNAQTIELLLTVLKERFLRLMLFNHELRC